MVTTEDLDAFAASVLPSLTAEELDAVRKYQSTAPAPLTGGLKWHEYLNAYVRDDAMPVGRRELATIARVVEQLDAAIAKSPLPFDLTAFRGLSNADSVADLERLLGRDLDEGPIDLPGFVSTSMDRARAERFFGEPVNLMLILQVPAGVPALWVPPLGDRRLRGQRELVFGTATSIAVRETTQSVQNEIASAEELVTVIAEVLP